MTLISRGVLLLPLLLSACSTARLSAQWQDVEWPPQAPRDQLYAQCEAKLDTIARICQSQLKPALQALGIRLLDSAEANNATLRIQLSEYSLTQQHSGPSVGFGMGGGYGHVGSGVGISFPIGSPTVQTLQRYRSESSLTQQGKIRWSAIAQSEADDIATQIKDLLQVSLNAARKAGAL